MSESAEQRVPVGLPMTADIAEGKEQETAVTSLIYYSNTVL